MLVGLDSLDDSSSKLEDGVEFVEGGVGLPTELLGGTAVDKNIIHKMKWVFAGFLLELSIHFLVDTRVGFAHMQKVRSKAILKH